jgi:hypothetical protein
MRAIPPQLLFMHLNPEQERHVPHSAPFLFPENCSIKKKTREVRVLELRRYCSRFDWEAHFVDESHDTAFCLGSAVE